MLGRACELVLVGLAACSISPTAQIMSASAGVDTWLFQPFLRCNSQVKPSLDVSSLGGMPAHQPVFSPRPIGSLWVCTPYEADGLAAIG